jgi:hypothetical protein
MNYIIDPDTLESYSIFSEKGLKLLKEYVRVYQEGGSRAQTYLTGIRPAAAAAENPCANVNANNMQLYRTEAEVTNNDKIKDTRIAATLKLIRVDHTPENCAESINLGELLNYYFRNRSIWRSLAQNFLVNRILRYNINIIQVPAEYAENAETLGETNLEEVEVGEGIGFVFTLY